MANSTKPLRKPPLAPNKKKRTRWLAFVILPLLACAGWWLGTTIYHKLTFRPTGQIAFVCKHDQICVVNADGSGRKQLTYEKYAKSPRWSPDGARIVFVGETYSPTTGRYYSALFTTKADGSDIRRLVERGADPAWSPDGTHIALIRYDVFLDENVAGIYVISKDGSDEIRLTNFEAYDPAWSPDGALIAFTTFPNGPNGKAEIHVMNADGSNQILLTNSPSRSPAWSPDGKRIAYDCGDEICVTNADSTGQVQLTHSFLNLQPSSPAWSPDGQYIAYSRQSPFCLVCNYSGEIWLMKADGTQQLKLTQGPIDLDPDWRP